MTTTQKIIARAAQIGITAREWQKGDKLRIYATTPRRDMSVYLEIDGTPDELTGASLKVFCNTDQHPNWIRSQVAEYRERFMGLFYAYVVEVYANVGPQPNGYGPSINEMIDKARAFFAAKTADAA